MSEVPGELFLVDHQDGVWSSSDRADDHIAWDDLQGDQKYSMMRASSQSRVTNLLFIRALTGTKVIKQNPIALDDDNAQRLWQITEQLTATSTTVR